MPVIINMYLEIGLWKLIEIIKNTRKAMGALAIPLFNIMLLYFSNIPISDI